MLIPVPPELLNVVRFVSGGCVLAEGATPEQQKAFEIFKKALQKASDEMLISE
jgi:hypothetical protein